MSAESLLREKFDTDAKGGTNKRDAGGFPGNRAYGHVGVFPKHTN